MLQILNDDIGKLSPDVIVITIDAIWGRQFDGFLQIARLVIEREIESQVIFETIYFDVGAGESDHGTAFDFGDLADERPNGARGRAH